MDIIETTNSNLEQKIHIFENLLIEGDLNIKINMPEDLGALLHEHKKIYSNSIYLPDWIEIGWVLDCQRDLYDPKIDIKNLKLLTSSSYHVQAVRKGNAKDITPLGVDGLIKTSDNKFIYGVRGGKVGRGEASIVPSGALSIREEDVSEDILRDPLFRIFYRELNHETAIEKNEIGDVRLVAYLTDPELSKSIQFIFYGETPLCSAEVRETV